MQAATLRRPWAHNQRQLPANATAGRPRPTVLRRAAAPVMDGAAARSTMPAERAADAASSAAAAAIGRQLLCRWLGAPADTPLELQHSGGPLRGTDCQLAVSATTVKAGERTHVLLAFVITSPSSSGGSSKGGLSVAELRSPVLHWGCVAGQGDRWQPPPAGWSTWPDVSHDARGGAWQTPFAEQALPGGGAALTMLLQLPWEGPLRSGGLACLVKAGSSSWLGNGETHKDYFVPSAQLPSVAEEALAGAAGTDACAADALAAPDAPLDMTRLAATPVAPPPRDTRKQQHHNDWRTQEDQQGNHHHHHGEEPELPNAGRRAKEPATDDTQVCTLSAAELHAAAAVQLSTWLQQQEDLEVPDGGPIITQDAFAVKGHGGTPLVVASTALWGSSASGERQAMLLLAAVGDVGLSGTRMPGLVMHWTGVAASPTKGPQPAKGGAAAAAAAVPLPQPEEALPEGWTTLPDLSWDAGSGFWETPMTRHLLQPATAPAGAGAGMLEAPGSPRADGGSAAAAAAANKFVALMRLPLQAPFSTGGVLFTLRTSRRQWLRAAEGGGQMFLDTSGHAQRMGVAPAPATPAPAADSQQQQQQQQQQGGVHSSRVPLDEDALRALAAAGLSQEEVAAFGGAVPAPAAAALASADADLASHIEAASSSRSRSAGSSGGGGFWESDAVQQLQPSVGSVSGGAVSGQGQQQQADVASAAGELFGPGGAAKFVRDFETGLPDDVTQMAWGLHPGGGALSGVSDVPPLAPHAELVGRIGQLEHKACRSLMHRYGIAADLVQELLPQLRDAAAAAPHSLCWPPPAGERSGPGTGAVAALVAVAVWLRLSSLRLLCWNRNYNVKPREISAALERLTARLLEVYEAAPQLAGIVVLGLSSAGRGGEGDMGQRIRDEILAIQQRNGCKGGMMEEWHQKLHNNSSPDDLAICQALLDYLGAGQQQDVYWASLASAGITPERLASYDRPIRSPPPRFSEQQLQQLTADLQAYRRTLAAVHSGADLAAAVDGVLGYDAGECKGKRVTVAPLDGVATPQLRRLLAALLSLVQGAEPGGSRSPSPGAAGSSTASKLSAMLAMERCLKLQALVVQARLCLVPALRGGQAACRGRLRDVIFLDMALEVAGRSALEASLGAVRAAAPSTLLGGLLGSLLQLPLASACLSALPGQAGSGQLAACLQQLQRLSSDCPGLDATAKARVALSVVQRLRALLAGLSASTQGVLQPTAEALAACLGLPGAESDATGPVALLGEEVVRGSAAATLSLLLNAVEPSLRRLAGVSTWSIVSRQPASVSGSLSRLTPCLSQLDAHSLDAQPGGTILLLSRLAGEEEVPAGVVGVVVAGDAPDVLSHAAVRARNNRVPVVACPSSEEAVVSRLLALQGKQVQLSITGDDSVHVTETEAAAGEPAGVAQQHAGSGAAVQLVAPAEWCGAWALTGSCALEVPGAAGAKAASAASLAQAAAADAAAGGLPPWLCVPPAAVLPHGVFDAVLQAPQNGQVALQLQQLAADVAAVVERGVQPPEQQLQQLRSLVMQLHAPEQLREQLTPQLDALAAAAHGSDASAAVAGPKYSWDAVWQAVLGVWASSWSSRALAALAKARVPLQHLRMGVLLQPLLPARYAWVAHTVDPASGSSSQVAVQLVVGLGEVLVSGMHPGSALGGVVQRSSLEAALAQQQKQKQAGSGGGGAGGGSTAAAPLPGARELLAAVDVQTYPSKDVALVAAGLRLPCGLQQQGTAGAGVAFMARSDSNAEDLPGFAGAGLFDSLPTCPASLVVLNYAAEPLLWDRAQAAGLLWQCALAAVAAERAVQSQQGAAGGSDAAGAAAAGLDVEGCVTPDGTVWLLQARPQV